MNRTKVNYWIDLVIAGAFVMSAASGIVFLFPISDSDILGIPYRAWSEIHTWGSLAMLAGVLAHLILHWKWIMAMTRKTFLPQPISGRTAASGSVQVRSRRGFVQEAGLGFASVVLFGASLRWFLDSLNASTVHAVTSVDGTSPATNLPVVELLEQDQSLVQPQLPAAAGTSLVETVTDGVAVDLPILPTPTATAEPTSTPVQAPVQNAPLAQTNTTGTVRCPKRIMYDPYPGKCRHYVDRDGDGYCDLSIPV